MFIGKNGRTIWKKHRPSKKARTRKENLMRHLPGVKARAKNAKGKIKVKTIAGSTNLACVLAIYIV